MKKLLNTFFYLTFGLFVAFVIEVMLYICNFVEITEYRFYIMLALFAAYAVCFFLYILIRAFNEKGR